MIKSIVIDDRGEPVKLTGVKTIRQVNHVLQLIAAASDYDPGEADLDDEQSVRPVRLTLGDVRLARRLTH